MLFTTFLFQSRIVEKPRSAAAAARMRFSLINANGAVTVVLLGIFGGAVISYLVALYVSLGAGFSIEDSLRAQKETRATVTAMEFAINEKQAKIMDRNEAYLEKMEKTSALRYIAPRGAEVSILARPQLE